MEIGKVDGAEVSFAGPGRPRENKEVDEPSVYTELPDFVLGSLVRVAAVDIHGMPQKLAGYTGKIIAMHSNIYAADIIFDGTITTRTVWLTSLELLS